MWRMAFFVALVIAGCAAPQPQQPRFPDREPFLYHITLTPYSAAICIARNARGLPLTTAEERTLGESSTEVVVRDRLGGVMAVARVDRTGPSSSDVRIRVSERVQEDNATFTRKLLTSCG